MATEKQKATKKQKTTGQLTLQASISMTQGYKSKQLIINFFKNLWRIHFVMQLLIKPWFK